MLVSCLTGEARTLVVALEMAVGPGNDKGRLNTASDKFLRGVVALVGESELLPRACTVSVLSVRIGDVELRMGRFDRGIVGTSSSIS